MHNLDVVFFIQGLGFSFFIQSWMKSCHPSVIFNEPCLPHMNLDFDNSCIIIFVLASYTQQ